MNETYQKLVFFFIISAIYGDFVIYFEVYIYFLASENYL